MTFLGIYGEIDGTSTQSSLTTQYTSNWSQTLKSEGAATLFCREKRTIVTTTSGVVKVLSGWQSTTLTPGSVIAGGYTVQEAYDETGIHQGQMDVTIEIPAYNYGISLYFQVSSAVNMTFYGKAMD